MKITFSWVQKQKRKPSLFHQGLQLNTSDSLIFKRKKLFSFWSRYFLMGLTFGFEIAGLLAPWINACCCVENAHIGDHSIKPNLNSLVSSICKCYVSTSLWFFWFPVLSCCVQCQRWNVDKNIYIKKYIFLLCNKVQSYNRIFMKCHSLLLCSIFLVVNCPGEPFCLFTWVNIIVFVIWLIILIILTVLFRLLNKTLGFLNNSWFQRCFISVDSSDQTEGKCLCRLESPR